MRKLSATIFESFGRGIPLDREMTVGAEKVRKRGVNKWRRRSGISITEALVGRVAVRPDHKYITKLLPEIPPSLCGCTKKSRTNTIQFHTQIQNKHNLYHQQKVAGNLVKSICIWYIDICIYIVWIFPQSQNWVPRVQDQDIQDINIVKSYLWGGEETDICKTSQWIS